MTVFALVSAGGSPGVTTSALALALSWPTQVIIAECDPSGGDILAGLLAGHVPASTGLLPLAVEAGRGADLPASALWRQLVQLDEDRSRLLLAGISDPRQSAGLLPTWPALAATLAAMPADVLADCGRLDSPGPLQPVLAVASLVVLVLRPTLRQVSRAQPRAEMLTSLVGRERLVTLVTGSGTHSSREVGRALGLPVAGSLPHDPRTASVLSDGVGNRRGLAGRQLVRTAAAAGRALREAAAAAGGAPASAVAPAQPGPAS
jgi:hypothetical protein